MSLAHSSSSTTEHSNDELKHGDNTDLTVEHGMTRGMGHEQLGLGVNDPQRWPKRRKVYASLASCGFTFALYETSKYPVP